VQAVDGEQVSARIRRIVGRWNHAPFIPRRMRNTPTRRSITPESSRSWANGSTMRSNGSFSTYVDSLNDLACLTSAPPAFLWPLPLRGALCRPARPGAHRRGHAYETAARLLETSPRLKVAKTAFTTSRAGFTKAKTCQRWWCRQNTPLVSP